MTLDEESLSGYDPRLLYALSEFFNEQTKFETMLEKGEDQNEQKGTD